MEKFSEELKAEIREILTSARKGWGDPPLSDNEKAVLEARCLGESTTSRADMGQELNLSIGQVGLIEKKLREEIRMIAGLSPPDRSLLGQRLHKIFEEMPPEQQWVNNPQLWDKLAEKGKTPYDHLLIPAPRPKHKPRNTRKSDKDAGMER